MFAFIRALSEIFRPWFGSAMTLIVLAWVVITGFEGFKSFFIFDSFCQTPMLSYSEVPPPAWKIIALNGCEIIFTVFDYIIAFAFLWAALGLAVWILFPVLTVSWLIDSAVIFKLSENRSLVELGIGTQDLWLVYCASAIVYGFYITVFIIESRTD